MARAEFVKAARKDIYCHGKRIEAVHERGKHAGQKYMKLDRTQPADENDKILIHKGESYWTWCFMNQNPQYSKTKPRPSQLTQSEFLSQYYGIQEQIEDFAPEAPEDVQEFVDDIVSQLEELRDECQDRFDNMPYQLQDADSGQMLQERIDECDSLISDLESIDAEYCPDDEENEDEEARQEWLDNVLSEIQGLCFNL